MQDRETRRGGRCAAGTLAGTSIGALTGPPYCGRLVESAMLSLGKLRGRPRAGGGEQKVNLLHWMAEHQVLAGFLALLTASVAPATTYISSTNALAMEEATAKAQIALEERREADTRAKEERAQDHEIRMAYFSKAVDPSLDDRARERVLRFLSRSFADVDLREWANNELKGVQRTIAELEQRNRDAERQRHAVEQELAAAKTSLERVAAEQKRASLERDQILNELLRSEAHSPAKYRFANSTGGRARAIEPATLVRRPWTARSTSCSR
jgi:hypothetical protein